MNRQPKPEVILGALASFRPGDRVTFRPDHTSTVDLPGIIVRDAPDVPGSIAVALEHGGWQVVYIVPIELVKDRVPGVAI